MNNMFIVIEGIDATGKTTLAKSLAKALNGIYYKTPGNVTEKDMKQLDSENVTTEERFNFYFQGCKRDISIINEIISNGTTVVCDRFIDTTISAHNAMGYINTTDAENFSKQIPRIQILLQADSSTIKKRLSERSNITRFELDEKLMLRTSEEFSMKKNDLILDTSTLEEKEILKESLNFINSL